MSAKYVVVASIEEARQLDDSEMPHWMCCLVEGVSWFILHRDCDQSDDGKAYLDTHSNNGRWVVMTPQTMGIAAGAAEAKAEDDAAEA